VAFILLALTDGLPELFLAMLIVGLGNGIVFTVRTAMLVHFFGADRLSYISSVQFAITHAAVAMAAFASLYYLAAVGDAAYETIFLANAATFIVLLAVILVIDSRSTAVTPGDATRNPRLADAIEPVRSPGFRPVLAIGLITSAFAFSQLAAVMPVVLTQQGMASTQHIGVLFTANSLAIVVLQAAGYRLAQRLGFVTVLALALVAWSLTAVGGASTALLGSSAFVVVVGVLVVLGVGFAVGEVLISPALQPLVVRRSPPARLGLYSGSMALVGALAGMLSPGIGLTVAERFGPLSFWTFLLAGTLIGLAVVRWLQRTETAVTMQGEPRPLSLDADPTA
jgi:MFS family permease